MTTARETRKWLLWPLRTVLINLRLLATWLMMRRLGVTLPAGAVLRVRRPLELVIATHWRAPFTDGIRCTLPAGTELVTAHAVTGRSRGVQCLPWDRDAFVERFVPADTRADPRFAGVSVTLRAAEFAACEVVGQAGQH